ncbi:TPA: universal stress protein [Candidatus Bathyarchaeota archaeon]|nr:universal stress protein [Candidatus Bathyarchaeota archaeon]HIJ07885.1 universal stress protein [Candidatus Bathyarchaeota archaeon]
MISEMKILVGVDGSAQSMRALAEAATIAKCFSGSVRIITVYRRGMESKADEILSGAKQLLEREKVEFNSVSILGSNPARALQTIAKQENFDLIVVGNRGLGSKASLLLGSVSRQVVADAECNVLVVKK